MEHVFAEIARAARMLDLDLRDPLVVTARRIAIAAVQDGYTEDEAYQFARSALFPTAALVAA